MFIFLIRSSTSKTEKLPNCHHSTEPANQKTGKYLKKQHTSGVHHLGEHLDGWPPIDKTYLKNTFKTIMIYKTTIKLHKRSKAALTTLSHTWNYTFRPQFKINRGKWTLFRNPGPLTGSKEGSPPFLDVGRRDFRFFFPSVLAVVRLPLCVSSPSSPRLLAWPRCMAGQVQVRVQ